MKIFRENGTEVTKENVHKYLHSLSVECDEGKRVYVFCDGSFIDEVKELVGDSYCTLHLLEMYHTETFIVYYYGVAIQFVPFTDEEYITYLLLENERLSDDVGELKRAISFWECDIHLISDRANYFEKRFFDSKEELAEKDAQIEDLNAQLKNKEEEMVEQDKKCNEYTDYWFNKSISTNFMLAKIPKFIRKIYGAL